MRLFYNGELARDTHVRQAIAAIRGHLDIEHEIIAALLDGIDGQTNIRQPLPHVLGIQLRAGQFAQPVVTNKHGDR